MELPQPSRPLGAEGRKTTHDFLSLYAHPPAPHDPRTSHGGCLKTHNFLQPLEKEDNIISTKTDKTDEISAEKPSPQAPPLPSGEHVLPGGIGTYSISYFNKTLPKTEGVANFMASAAISSNDRKDENSNCSSYTAGSGSGRFTFWEDSSSKKGKTGKENLSDINVTKETILKAGQWPMERVSESPSNHRSFSSHSSSHPPSQKSHSFLDMINSARWPHAKEEETDDDFTFGKESSSHRGELRIKVDEKRGNDQKANTPRSKHSATEQRRRCKINDRFQALRALIPHSDQKRDKASFLLEVIEYIKFLQEKVSKYEGSNPGWNGPDPTKLAPWRSSPNLAESFLDHSQGVNGSVLMFSAKPEESVFPSIKQWNQAEPDIHNSNNEDNAIAIKAIDQQNMLINKATPLVPMSIPLQPNIFTPFRNNSSGAMQPALRIASDAENTSPPQLRLWQSQQQPIQCSSDRNNHHHHQELGIEGGTIKISSIYSQGLLNSLTQALQSSGVDLSQASISVQVGVGKRANNGQIAPSATDIDGNVDRNDRGPVRERGEDGRHEDSDQATKRLKMGDN